MKYITHKRFKGAGLEESFNLSYGTELEEQGGLLFYNGKLVCLASSENAHQHFAQNDDGNGLERGKLTREIQAILAKSDSDYQRRWDRVWGNLHFHKYRRQDHEEHWLWAHEFFNAPIKDLKRILTVVKGAR